jgi:hypothetical protein
MRAGTPAAIESSGISPRTTALAPMMAPAPTRDPRRIATPRPIQESAPMLTGEQTTAAPCIEPGDTSWS